MRSSLILILLLSFSTHAGLFECMCKLVGMNPKEPKLVSCIPNKVVEVIEKSKLGYDVKLSAGKNQYEGVLVEQDFNYTKILLSDKSVKKISNKKITQIKSLDSSEVPVTIKDQYKLQHSNIQNFIAAKRREGQLLAMNQERLVKEFDKVKEFNKQELKEYVQKEASVIQKKIEQKFETGTIGFHFNLHGGIPFEYASGGGLKFSRGDIALAHGAGGSIEERVYFFKTSDEMSLYDIIAMGDMRRAMGGGRMGTAVNIFNLEDDYFRIARQEGGISNETDIFFSFNPSWTAKQSFNGGPHSRIGIPMSTYMTPPMDIYGRQIPKTIGLTGLNREQENLFYLRLIELRILGSL